MRRRNRNFLLYLVLNLLVSAGATYGVLWFWDRTHPATPQALQGILLMTQAAGQPVSSATPSAAAITTPIPNGVQVIQIDSVIGAGDLPSEVVTLKRLGDGDLSMTGWQLKSGRGQVYHFPSSPVLVLFKGGAIQIYSGPGEDTATALYWNRKDAAWKSGDTLTLLDAQGQSRAKYVVP
jgi:competence protein ComEC